MNKKNLNKESPKAPSPDRFMESLRKTLEHIGDTEWLDQHSPLASVFFAGANVLQQRQRQVMLIGRDEVDTRLRAVWHEWETSTLNPLQGLLWEAVCQLPRDIEDLTQAILLLTYFDHENPKQSQVIDLLALGRSTYYRHLERSVETLGNAVVRMIRPPLQLEKPKATALVGREQTLESLSLKLNSGHVAHVVGGSGLGKSALAANLADKWPHGVFWYTFRPGLTDYLEQLLFAVAYFLHEQGASGLWLNLISTQEPINHSRAMMAIRNHLSELADQPPLFCFDEADLLLAEELNDSEEHLLIRSFLDEWAQMDRSGSPLLLIGQKLLMEPDANCLFALSPFTESELTSLLSKSGLELTPDQSARLLTFTRGNPLLLNLFSVLYRHNPSLADSLDDLTSPITLSWFINRLSQHLTTAEEVVLHELSIFPAGAPQDGWRRTRKQMDTLLELGIATRSGIDEIILHPAIRDLIYQQLPHVRKLELHKAAGNLLAERGQFTDAAWHYMQGESPEMAIWTWYTHQQHEIDQGRGSAALDLFGPLAQTSLPRSDDQRALALLLAPLLKRAGRFKEGLDLLDQVHWANNKVSSIVASDIRGELLAEDGRIEQSLQEFRRGLESVQRLRRTEEAEFHLQMGRRLYSRLGDIEGARREGVEARIALNVYQARIEEVTGHYQSAQAYYTDALKLAEQTTDLQRLAKIHQGLGFLEARLGNTSAAVLHAEEAERLYQLLGDQIGAIGVPNSIRCVAYILNKEYASAVGPAEIALEYFAVLNHSYWSALNETYLAEAWLYLDDLDQAERYAQSALHREEVMVRPYCLFILGHVRRIQQRFDEAERYCREAIASGEELEEPSALAPAWSALGETLRDVGRIDEAQSAFEESLTLWQQLHNQQEVELIQSMIAELPMVAIA